MDFEQAPWYPILKAFIFGVGVLLAIPLFNFLEWLFTTRRSSKVSNEDFSRICERNARAYRASLYGISPGHREPDCIDRQGIHLHETEESALRESQTRIQSLLHSKDNFLLTANSGGGETMVEQKNTANGSDSSKAFKRDACLSRINSLITYKQQLAKEIGKSRPADTQTGISPYKSLEQAFQEAIDAEIIYLLSLK